MSQPHESELAYVAAFIHDRQKDDDFAEVYCLLLATSGVRVGWPVHSCQPSWSARYNVSAYLITQARPGYEQMFKRVANWLLEEAPTGATVPAIDAAERLRKLVLGFCDLWDERSKDLATIGQRGDDLETIGEAKAQALCAKYLREAVDAFR